MPEAMRTLAEKSVAQTRELCEYSLEAVLESWERFVDAGQGAVALTVRLSTLLGTISIPVSVLR